MASLGFINVGSRFDISSLHCTPTPRATNYCASQDLRVLTVKSNSFSYDFNIELLKAGSIATANNRYNRRLNLLPCRASVPAVKELQIPPNSHQRSELVSDPSAEVASGDKKVQVAFFDVDGTITASNVVVPYVQVRMAELSNWSKVLWVPYFLLKVVLYLVLDRIDRGLFNQVFYWNYRNRKVASKDTIATMVHKMYLQPKTFNGALEHIRKLQHDGFHIVLVTGGLDFLVAPLAKELGADAVFAAELEEVDGRFTGKLASSVISSAEKGRLVQEYAATHRADLANCHAYGDSVADLAMLEAVGFPHAVKPESRLRRIAVERGWPIEDWEGKEEKKK